MENKETKIKKNNEQFFLISIIAEFSFSLSSIIKWKFNITALCNGNFYVLYQNLMLAAPIKATELKTLGKHPQIFKD